MSKVLCRCCGMLLLAVLPFKLSSLQSSNLISLRERLWDGPWMHTERQNQAAADVFKSKVCQPPADPQGFLAINECLQSEGGPPEVFAAGDVASCAKHPRPKAGVFAVRQVGSPAREVEV
eukprot:1156796-Pelagomonas_calceolata.AAC.6